MKFVIIERKDKGRLKNCVMMLLCLLIVGCGVL